MSKLPATKRDLDEAMKATATAIDATEKSLRTEIQDSEKRTTKAILDRIDRLENTYGLDRRVRRLEREHDIKAT